METSTETEEQVELIATLIPTSTEADELHAVCVALEANPIIRDAT